MIITSIKENLAKGLATVNRAVPNTKAPIPIIQNILIQTTPNGISLTGTNLQLTIKTEVEAIIDQEGAIAIPARLFTEFINTLPNEPVRFTVPEGSMMAKLACATAKANINGANPDDFPPLPQLPEAVTASIAPKDFKTAIARTAFAAAKEESRPILTGIFLEIKDSTITMAAADGFRLAINKTQLPSAVPTDFTAVIPATALQELHRMIPDDEQPIDILVDPKRTNVTFRVGKSQLITQLITGDYPHYEQLVPTGHTTSCVFDAKTLSQTARTASIFAKESSDIIRLEMTSKPKDSDKPAALISAEAADVGSNTGLVPLDSMEGEDTKIAFNGRYLLELLSHIDPDQVTLRTTTDSSPGLFTFPNSDEYIHVIMPMFINW